MSYSEYYTGGWQDGESGATPITAAALNHMEDEIESMSSKWNVAGTAIQSLTNSSLNNVNVSIPNSVESYSMLFVQLIAQGWSNVYVIPAAYSTSVWAHFGYHNGSYCTIEYSANNLKFKDPSFASGISSATVKVYALRR